MFELIGVGRFKGAKVPNLVMPIYRTRSTNYNYIHELDLDLIVKKFKKLDISFLELIILDKTFVTMETYPGLVCFEYSDNLFFVGTKTDLRKWIKDNEDLYRADLFLRALLTDIIEEEISKRMNVWRDYIKSVYSASFQFEYMVDAKYLEIQNREKIWKNIYTEEKKEQDLQSEIIKKLLHSDKDSVLNWLSQTENFEISYWKRIWEHADRYLLLTEESRDVVKMFLEYVLDEAPHILYSDISYLCKRSYSIDLSNKDAEFSVLFLEMLKVGTIIFKRSHIKPGDAITYIKHAFDSSKSQTTDIINGAIDILSNVSWVQNELGVTSEDSISRDRPQVNHETFLEILSIIYVSMKNSNNFGLLEAKELVDGCVAIFDSITDSNAINKAKILFNKIMRQFGVDYNFVMRIWNSNEIDDYPEKIHERMAVGKR